MQVLKENIRNAILDSAEDDFIEHGYRSSSLRRIAANAGITASNLYRYFENKETIFKTLIMPAVRTIKSVVEHDIVSVDSLKEQEITDLIEEISVMAAGGFVQNKKSMLLLLKKSEGTKFFKIRTDIVDHFISHVLEHFEKEKIDVSRDDISIFPKAYAISTVESIAAILNENVEDEVLFKNLKLFFKVSIYNFIQTIEILRGSK